MIVIIESPYIHEHPVDGTEYDIYLNRCLRDSIFRGEDPLATHAMYTRPGVLDLAKEGWIATYASDSFAKVINRTIFYTDYGFTDRMQLGLDRAEAEGHTILHRKIGLNTRDDYARDTDGSD